MQAAKCYEVVRRHGLPVIGMEMVKGGGLSKEEKLALWRAMNILVDETRAG